MNFATWKAILAPRQEFHCLISIFSAFCTERCTSPPNDQTLDFCATILYTLTITLLCVNRWRKHLDPHLHMLWKVSAQTQSTNSPWQPSPPKASEPSPMKYHRRPCKPVCSLLFSVSSFLFVGWLTMGFPPVKPSNYFMSLLKWILMRLCAFLTGAWKLNFLWCQIHHHLWTMTVFFPRHNQGSKLIQKWWTT